MRLDRLPVDVPEGLLLPRPGLDPVYQVDVAVRVDRQIEGDRVGGVDGVDRRVRRQAVSVDAISDRRVDAIRRHSRDASLVRSLRKALGSLDARSRGESLDVRTRRSTQGYLSARNRLGALAHSRLLVEILR